MRVYKLLGSEAANRLVISPYTADFEKSATQPLVLSDFESYSFEPDFFDHRIRKLEDITFVSHFRSLPIFSARAADVIEKECGIEGHWHDIDVVGNSYRLLNLIDLTDAVDEGNSGIVYWQPVKRFPNKQPGVKTYDLLQFNHATVENSCLFRDRSLSSFNLFCTDRFVELVKSYKWTGIACLPVWDSEMPAFKSAPLSKDIVENSDIYGENGTVSGYENLIDG